MESLAAADGLLAFQRLEQLGRGCTERSKTSSKKTLRGISSVYIKEFEAKVENDRITSYRINAKVTFTLESKS